MAPTDGPSHHLTAADVQARPPAALVRDFWAEVSNVEAGEEIGAVLDQAISEALRSA